MKRYILLLLLVTGCHKKNQPPIAAINPTTTTTQHSFTGVVASSSTVTVNIAPFDDETDTLRATRQVGWSHTEIPVCPSTICYTISGYYLTLKNDQATNQSYTITTNVIN